tara:strand:+ start:419 stop:817 length:399 start_codon:yes stop_codon:yes gene_type:complete
MLGSWPTFTDRNGVLIPIELDQLPFVPKRVFYVTNVPKGEERGNHAHYTTEQILTCIQGEIIVKLHNGTKLETVTLKPNQWTFIDKLIWDSQIFVTGNDILMSICSSVYNKSDYIEDFDIFKRIVGALICKN